MKNKSEYSKQGMGYDIRDIHTMSMKDLVTVMKIWYENMFTIYQVKGILQSNIFVMFLIL